MSDLVERLRAWNDCAFDQDGPGLTVQDLADLKKQIKEAADEIEHLNGIIKTAMGGKRAFEDRIALIKEIERLQADLQFSYENKTASDDTWRKEVERLHGQIEWGEKLYQGVIKDRERLRAALGYYASGIAGRGDIARMAMGIEPSQKEDQ